MSLEHPEPLIDASSAAVIEQVVEPGHNEQSLARWAFLIGAGVFATTLSQPGVISLPFQNLLKSDLHVSREAMASFFAISTFAWNLKPIAGIFTDSIPLFGSRRKNYLVFSAVLAAALYFAVGVVPRTYLSILVTMVLANCMLVVGSTVVGGLAVEIGQRDKATGRTNSARYFVMNACTLIGGPLGGFLAARAFGVTAFAGGLIALSVVPFALWLIKEPRIAAAQLSGTAPNAQAQGWANAKSKFREQFKNILKSKTLWIASGLLFLVYISPGFSTPLYYYQIDTLKLSSQFIGNLAVLSGGFGILGALIYAYLCRKLDLRTLLYISIVISTIGTVCYLFYTSGRNAMFIESENGFLATIAELALMDLAARATPKGSEGLGFALMMSVRNGGQSLSDIFGSWLIDQHHVSFFKLVWLNAGTTALVLAVIPFLPAILTETSDA